VAGDADPARSGFPRYTGPQSRRDRRFVARTGTQIAVGTPVMSGTGHVTVFAVNVLDTTPAAFTCPVVLIGNEARFGRAMTVVDLTATARPTTC
jgi:hypothetical protein